MKEDEEEMEMDAEVDLVAELGFDDQVINLVLAAGACSSTLRRITSSACIPP